jgi:hypothetical protein
MRISVNAGATRLSYYPVETSRSYAKLISSKYVSAALRVVTITANTIMPHDLSAEDKDAREKGLQLVTHIEHLSQTDEGFQRWIQEGIDDIEAGRTVLFSEDGWKE